jgi:hypothetical protein
MEREGLSVCLPAGFIYQIISQIWLLGCSYFSDHTQEPEEQLSSLCRQSSLGHPARRLRTSVWTNTSFKFK